MAEGSGEHGRGAAEGSKRRARSDWFGQALGDEWVEMEPGIYRQLSPVPDDADTRLDQRLLDAIPGTEPDEEPEPEESPAKQRRWLRR